MLKIHDNPMYMVLNPFVFRNCFSTSKIMAEPWEGEVPTYEEQRQSNCAVMHLAMHVTDNQIMYMSNSCRHPHVSGGFTSTSAEASQCFGTAYDEAERARQGENWKLFFAIRSKTLYSYSRADAYEDFQHIFHEGTECHCCKKLIPYDEIITVQGEPYCTGCANFDAYHNEYCLLLQACPFLGYGIDAQRVTTGLIGQDWHIMPVGHTLNEEEIPLDRNFNE